MEICQYCNHTFHGVTEREGGGFSGLPTHPENLCGVVVQVSETTGREHKCNCDGKTQCFAVTADSYEEAERLAGQILASGYQVHRFNDGPRGFAVQPLDRNWKKSGPLLVIAFSRALPPVASREEFEERIGLKKAA